MSQPDDFVHPFAEVALSNITRDYPYAAHHVARSVEDIVEPREKNPAFANCGRKGVMTIRLSQSRVTSRESGQR